MVPPGPRPSGARIGADLGLLRAPSSQRRSSRNRMTGRAPPERPARCATPMSIPNHEPGPLDRCAGHTWIAGTVQAGRRIGTLHSIQPGRRGVAAR